MEQHPFGVIDSDAGHVPYCKTCSYRGKAHGHYGAARAALNVHRRSNNHRKLSARRVGNGRA